MAKLRKRTRTSWEAFQPHPPHGFATHLPARQTKSPATLANKEITPCVGKETFHDSYRLLNGCSLFTSHFGVTTGYCRLGRRIVLWACFGAGFWPSSLHNFAIAKEKKCLAPWKATQASAGFWIPGTGFRILCQWNLESRFQSFVRFRIHRARFWIPWTVFRISKPRIPHSISMADFSDSGFHGQKFLKFRNPDSLTRGARSDCVPKQSQSAIRHNIDAVSREPHNGQLVLKRVVHSPVCPNKLWQSVIITEGLTFGHLMPKLWQCQLVVVVGCIWTRSPKNKIIGEKNIWQLVRYHICSLIPPILKIQTSTCAIIGLI